MLNNDNILVLIQLVGGNDSLSTVTPLDSYSQLAAHRENVLIPENKLLTVGSLGFHPAVAGIYDLYKQGQAAIVNNVGYPLPNRSHFRSMDIWNSGSPSNEQWSTGWLGRLLDLYHPTYPVSYPNAQFADPLAITVGNIVSDTCQGALHNFSHVVDSSATFAEIDKCRIGAVPNKAYGDLVGYLNDTISLANSYTTQVQKAFEAGHSLAQYPHNNQLAQELKITAKLISGGLQTKIYVLSLGGFDTHAYQVGKTSPLDGMHNYLLQALSEALSAFVKDLKKLHCFDKVSIMTYSEFGRQICSNSAMGTDHGDATSLFVIGNKLKAQQIGKTPTISIEVDRQKGLDMEIDFRDLYSSVLSQWFAVPAATMEPLFKKKAEIYAIFNA